MLVTETSLIFRQKYFSNNQELLRQFDDAKRAHDLGFITTEEVCRLTAGWTGLSETEVFNILEHGSSLDGAMLEFVRSLKAQTSCKIGMLSNITPNRLDDFFTTEDKQLFDVLSLSYEMGYVKPDKMAFQVALGELGVLAEEAIFIDDQPRNVQAAKDLGIQAIHFTSQTALEKKLQQYGILPL